MNSTCEFKNICFLHWTISILVSRSNHSTNMPLKDLHQRAFFPASTEQLRRLSEMTLPFCTTTTLTDNDTADTTDKNCISVAHVELNQEPSTDNVSKSVDQSICETIQISETVDTVNECTEQDKAAGTDVFHIVDETGEIAVEQEVDRLPELKHKEKADQVDAQSGKQEKTMKTLLERRRVSLPEMTTVPNLQAIKIK